MREILFKAKRKDNGEWVEGYVYRISESLNPVIVLKDKCGESYEVDPETVCQYTGLTDKNGKKIFEDDVLKYKEENEYTVKFVYGMFICEGFYNPFFDVTWDAFSEGTEEIEAIGNIHDEED